MPMKYAEITIIKKTNIISILDRWCGYENITNDNDNIIISFDDEIVSTKYEYIDKKYKFHYIKGVFWPRHFQIEGKTKLSYRFPSITEDYDTVLEFGSLFNNDYNDVATSRYNMIYEDSNKKEVFAICKIKSNEKKPQFILAYDDTIFDKSDIIYSVDRIFKHKFY